MHRCYCSGEDTDEESKARYDTFLEIDTTPSDEACIILHHHYGDAYGPITGDYKCATSWKFTEAIHQQIFDYDDDLQTWQTWYGCGPRTLDGSVWSGDFWCEAVDASGEYVGWCDCDCVAPTSLRQQSAPTTSAPTAFVTPPFNVGGNRCQRLRAPASRRRTERNGRPTGTGRCAASWLYERDREPWVPRRHGLLRPRPAEFWLPEVRRQSPSLVRGRRRRRDYKHTGWCYCSDEDTDEESKRASSTTWESTRRPRTQACGHHGDDGRNWRLLLATSWKFTEALHHQLFGYGAAIGGDFDLQTRQTFTAAVREQWTDLVEGIRAGARPWTRVAMHTSVGASARRRRRRDRPRQDVRTARAGARAGGGRPRQRRRAQDDNSLPRRRDAPLPCVLTPIQES